MDGSESVHDDGSAVRRSLAGLNLVQLDEVIHFHTERLTAAKQAKKRASGTGPYKDIVLSRLLWVGSVQRKIGGAARLSVFKYADEVFQKTGLTGFIRLQPATVVGCDALNMIVMNMNAAKFTPNYGPEYQVRVESTYFDSMGDQNSRLFTIFLKHIPADELEKLYNALTAAGAQRMITNGPR